LAIGCIIFLCNPARLQEKQKLPQYNKRLNWNAPVAESVDAADSKSVSREGVGVQVPPRAPVSVEIVEIKEFFGF
jgi:hypothetical protein